jgi:hypothetical protein
VLGITGTEEDLERDLAASTAGSLGTKLVASVDRTLDLRRFHGAMRAKANAPQSGKGGGGGARVPRIVAESNRDKEINGVLGEAFAFEQFRGLLRDFDEACWVSANRACYGLPDTGTDAHGCDFIYRDIEGTLTGRADQPECHIEIKATTGDGTNPFPMSIAEWKKAQSCNASSGRQVYVIVRVRHVRTAPAIADILIDPVHLWSQHALAITAHDLWLYPGSVQREMGGGQMR